MSDLAVTWWGHASTTLELGAVRIAVDPLLVDRLFHLRRYAVTPLTDSADADVVLVSHLHIDHCHLPSLRRFAPDVPILVPRGGEQLLAGLGRDRLVPVAPGEHVEVAGVSIDVLPASHDGRRLPWSRTSAPALGFRIAAGGLSAWFPGDTELRDDMADVEPVDLALAPVGGWGPTLGEGHMGPEDAAVAVARVGARLALPVHWGTFWPVGFDRVARANHERLFMTPGSRFADALAASGVATVVPAEHGRRVQL
jgi:L-ascorbate metabolism protein UlaG (beta-lactamase superfamily)